MRVVHDEYVDALAAVLARAHDVTDRRDRVAIGVDGPDAAGKSTFADRLAALMGPAVLRASLDDFQRPREERNRRGRFSPQGYYLDAFDHAAARRVLLDPFLAGADTVRTATSTTARTPRSKGRSPTFRAAPCSSSTACFSFALS